MAEDSQLRNYHMNYKQVIFGRTITIQVQCPNCEIWQFQDESKICCDCDTLLNEDLTRKPTEYRTELSNWRDKVSGNTKEIVFQRDEFNCQYCGVWCYDSWIQNPKSVTIDHIIPVKMGGNNKVENLITCCRNCNLTKNDRVFETFEQAREYILGIKDDKIS